MKWIRVASFGLMAFLAGGMASYADGRTREPFELVRSLNALQDEIARGSSAAHAAQQTLMASISAELARVEPERWKDPRNQRAAVLYVLSGGDPRILRQLLGLGHQPGQNEDMAKGALAYAEGRNAEAAKHLAAVDARSLERGLAGAVALVQATLVAKTEPKKAMPLLDAARLLAPGTLVEEVALRRHILLLPTVGQLDRLDQLLTRYVRQFGRSYYASVFWWQLGAEIAALDRAEDPSRHAQLGAILDLLDPDGRQQAYLAIAHEGIKRGKVRLARFAAGKAIEAVPAGSPGEQRAKLYEAAALIVTDEHPRGLSDLAGIARDKLPEPDAVLLDAAIGVAQQIRRLSEPGPTLTDAVLPAGRFADRVREFSEIGLRAVARAQTLMTNVDSILSGQTR